ncbi:MAG TPA: hypothetical protein VJ654_14300 [Noviherbaspirillum sp.]|nr:hypothetical protein [Noviherbaspirillum sp.]
MTTTELTLPQRAAVALGTGEHEKQLVLMAAEAQTITEIKNKDGRDQCHSMMMTLKNARVAIEKTGKTAREDAQAFSKAVIAEEKRLIAITEAEEARLQKLRDDWDAAVEAERQAKIEAERNRVAKIKEAIGNITSAPLRHVASNAEKLDTAIEFYRIMPISQDEYAEFVPEAEAIRAQTLEKLTVLRDAAIAKEAEAARLAAEREELARLRAETEARRKEDERIAAEKRAADEAELKALREKQEAELAAQRAEIARQQAERDAEIAAQAKAAKEAQEAAEAKLAAERAEFERKQREAAEEVARLAEHERLAKLCREFVANAMAQAETPSEWAYSFNEENYNGSETSIEAAIAEALAEADDREAFWIGKCKRFVGRGDADDVIERLQEQCYEECGEFGETYLEDVTKEERQELEDFITAWAARVDRSNFYTVEGAQKFTVEEARKLIETPATTEAA